MCCVGQQCYRAKASPPLLLYEDVRKTWLLLHWTGAGMNREAVVLLVTRGNLLLFCFVFTKIGIHQSWEIQEKVPDNVCS